MKKFVLLITAVAVFGLLAGPASGQEDKCFFGPYQMTSTSEDCIPDLPLYGDTGYAGVTIDTCAGSLDLADDAAVCNGDEYAWELVSLITVTPNEALLVPEANYGIQRFSLNYRQNDPENVKLVVVDPPFVKDLGWRTGYERQTANFGVFTYDYATGGDNRKDPLTFVICYKGTHDLSVDDFYDVDEDQYMFVAHIGGFEDYNGEDDCNSAFFALPSPFVLVELADFRAVGLVNNVILQWTTAAEIDNAGFNLYRADGEDGDYVKVNAKLIPTKDSPINGATYRYLDTTVQRGKTYYYMLEDVDLNGVATMHKAVPVSPRFIFGMGR